MKEEELWVGDMLEVIVSGEVGTFEGMHRDLLMIKIDEKIQYFRSHQVRLAAIQFVDAPLVESKSSEKVKMPTINFDPVIDLHLDNLSGFDSSRWPYPLDFQKQQCRNFVEKAISLQIRELTIIHGIGEGVLQSAIWHLLEEFSEVVELREASHSGAVKVLLAYN